MLKSKFAHFVRATFLLVIMSVAGFAADTVKIAENGKALATIEVSPDASVAVRSVANEMAAYLERISGAPFRVAQQPGAGPRIVLGRNSDFSSYKLGDRLRGNGQQAFILRTAGDKVLLLGVTDEAVSHAAYTFLEKLGVRWFFPTQEWEIVPSTKTLTANFDEVQSPDISLHRDIWYGSMTGYTTPNHLRLDWMRRNRMKTDGPNTSHSWIGLDPVKDFQENPEWFALVNGQRRNSKPNYGHPEVIKRAIASSMAAADNGAKSISVSAPDGLGFCECDQCLQVAGVARDTVYRHNHAIFGKRPDGTDVCVTSETIFRMANAVAAEVGKKYPSVLIGVFAYSGYAHPPSFDLAPNIYVAVTSAYRRTPLSFDEQIRIYSEKSKQLGIYDYYNIAVWGTGLNPGRNVKISDLAERIPFYHANSVLGINAEATNNWLPSGLDYYVSSKLMWNVKTDVNAVYADFLDKAFGNARVPMKSYYDRWQSKANLNPATLGAALGDLIAAYRMADNEAAKKRIAQLYLYNRFLRLEMKRGEVKDNPVEAARVDEQYVDLYWRMKDFMLIHDLVTGGVRRPLVPGFTAQEIDTLMAEDAAWIKDSHNLFLTYSRNLVPITSAGKAIPGLKEQAVATDRFRTLTLIMPAQAGETIELEIGAEEVLYSVWYMTPELFRSDAGAAHSEVLMNVQKATDKISFQAAKTGYYRVGINDPIFKSINRPYAVERAAYKSETLYFYVPTGTREFKLVTRAHGSPTVVVRDAAGNVVFEQKGAAAGVHEGLPGILDVTIKVPPGTDGAIWSVTGPGDVNNTASISLTGVPRYMSFSPHQLLVAEEYLK